ncbi:MAG TPA: DUF1844 domain-containing protein [Deltaproteobacteria bacterium]|nr:DUF1844 domain-containing protein [Deltaproteobacteria bacterium]HPJ93608.1 DUF1844 domain-containing protein [Deltaproteobacteria bacterium]HPR50981.1 DUF1844 domain-containing protein [Deltaproteobacteria bacterium]
MMGDDSKGYTFTDKRGENREESARKEHGSVNGPDSPGQGGATSALPVIDFPTLIMSFASAAMISLGRVPDPMTGQVSKDLALAKQNIDIISLLQEKTRGNLLPEEVNLVEGILYELRICYVEAKKGEK